MKKLQLQFFKRKRTFRKKGSDVNPDFYWHIVLYSTAALMLGAAAFGFYLFTAVSKSGGSADDATATAAGTVKKERLDAALKYFSDRKVKSNATINSPAPIVDPSL